VLPFIGPEAGLKIEVLRQKNDENIGQVINFILIDDALLIKAYPQMM